MRSKQTISSRIILGISILAVAMVFAVGDANAQVAYIDQGNIAVEVAAGETARINAFGDIFLGGNGWSGLIQLKNSSGVTVGQMDLSTLTLGSTGDDGDIVLKDSINNASTVLLDGTTGQLTLGNSASTEDGDITILDNDGTSSIFMDGASGNLTNQLGGSGLVKGWARINSNGTVASCYRCSTNAANTQKVGTGSYEVDFTFSSDITSRPVLAVIDSHTTGSLSFGTAQVGFRSGDPSSVWVITRYPDDVYLDRPFTVVVY